LILKRFLEGWTASFFGHPVKLGRLFQILSDQLHDAIPSYAQVALSFRPSNHPAELWFLGSILAQRPEKGNAAGIQEVRRSGFPHGSISCLCNWKGHIICRLEFEAENDEFAMDQARTHLDGLDMEVWEHKRVVGKLRQPTSFRGNIGRPGGVFRMELPAEGLMQQQNSSFDEGYRLQLLIDAVVDYAIYMIDPEGLVLSWNSGAFRLKGYSADEIIGRHFSEFYTPEDRAADLPARALATARESGRFHGEGWRVRKDGTRFWALVVVDAIRDTSGTPRSHATSPNASKLRTRCSRASGAIAGSWKLSSTTPSSSSTLQAT
jgi:PAS domain S-box-containing protein